MFEDMRELREEFMTDYMKSFLPKLHAAPTKKSMELARTSRHPIRAAKTRALDPKSRLAKEKAMILEIGGKKYLQDQDHPRPRTTSHRRKEQDDEEEQLREKVKHEMDEARHAQDDLTWQIYFGHIEYVDPTSRGDKAYENVSVKEMANLRKAKKPEDHWLGFSQEEAPEYCR